MILIMISVGCYKIHLKLPKRPSLPLSGASWIGVYKVFLRNYLVIVNRAASLRWSAMSNSILIGDKAGAFWSWSSAQANRAGTNHDLVTVTLMLKRIGDWSDWLSGDGTMPAFENCGHSGPVWIRLGISAAKCQEQPVRLGSSPLLLS